MAKSGSFEKVDPASVAKAAELKKELLRLVILIAEEEEFPIETFDRASRVLSDLKDLKSPGSTKHRFPASLGNFQEQQPPPPPAKFQDRPQQTPFSPSKNRDESTTKSPTSPSTVSISDSVPECFLCPISRQIMKDPVILSSGVTFDRLYVQSRLSVSSRICPATDEILEHSYASPNLFAREIIYKWCKDHGIELQPEPVNASYPTQVVIPHQRVRAGELLEMISSAPMSEKSSVIHELRVLSKRVPGIRPMLGEYPDAVNGLTSFLKDCKPGSDAQEHVVATILNFAILDENKGIVGEDPNSIPCLIGTVRTGSMQTRANAAAALFTLAGLDSNKVKIGECEMRAMEALADLLLEGDAIGKKDAAQAIFLLCVLHENRVRAVKEGALSAVLKILKDGQLVDELLSVAALISNAEEATEVLIERHGVPEFLQLLINSDGCARKQENLAVILFAICRNNREALQEVREHEEVKGTMAKLARKGTARARRKAAGILDRMKMRSNESTGVFSMRSA
ncbi:hypothetical protein ACLOJK_024111 [Asimina triloba]